MTCELNASNCLQISADDGFPQSLCENCLSRLESAYQFRILSEISEQKLKNKQDEGKLGLELNSNEECDDGQSIDNFEADDHLDNNDGFEM